MVKVSKFLFLASTVGLLATAPAAAATDGTFGATSTGTVGINASVPGRVRISKLTDIDLTNLDPTVAASRAQNVCVWSNAASRRYSILATGSGSGSAFTLDAAGAPAAVPYTVQWSSTSGQSSGTDLLAGTSLGALTSTAINSDCSAGPATTASLIVGMDSSTLQSMTSGIVYTGTLTLMVAPD
jgi:hypothetical protein